MMRGWRSPLLLLVVGTLLGGCLEVDQYPAYVHGEYAGKKDDLAPTRKFGNHQTEWQAAVSTRTGFQNEYLRAKP